ERLRSNKARIVELAVIFVEHIDAAEQAQIVAVIADAQFLAKLLEVVVEFEDADAGDGQAVRNAAADVDADRDVVALGVEVELQRRLGLVETGDRSEAETAAEIEGHVGDAAPRLRDIALVFDVRRDRD